MDQNQLQQLQQMMQQQQGGGAGGGKKPSVLSSSLGKAFEFLLKKIYLPSNTDIDAQGNLIDNTRKIENDKIKARKQYLEQQEREREQDMSGIEHDISRKYTNNHSSTTAVVKFPLYILQIGFGIPIVAVCYFSKITPPDFFNVFKEDFWHEKLMDGFYFLTMSVGAVVVPSSPGMLCEAMRFGMDYAQASARNAKYSRVLTNEEFKDEKERERAKYNTKEFVRRYDEMVQKVDGHITFNDDEIQKNLKQKITVGELDKWLIAKQKRQDLSKLYDLDQNQLKKQEVKLDSDMQDAVNADKKNIKQILDTQKDGERHLIHKHYYGEEAFFTSSHIQKMLENIDYKTVFKVMKGDLNGKNPDKPLNHEAKILTQEFLDDFSKIKNQEEYKDLLAEYSGRKFSKNHDLLALNAIFQMCDTEKLQDLYANSFVDQASKMSRADKINLVCFLAEEKSKYAVNIIPHGDEVNGYSSGVCVKNGDNKLIVMNTLDTMKHENAHNTRDITRSSLSKADYENEVNDALSGSLIDAKVNMHGEYERKGGLNKVAQASIDDIFNNRKDVKKHESDIMNEVESEYYKVLDDTVGKLQKMPEFSDMNFAGFHPQKFGLTEEDDFLKNLDLAGGISKEDHDKILQIHNDRDNNPFLKMSNRRLKLNKDIEEIDKKIEKLKEVYPNITKLDDGIDAQKKRLVKLQEEVTSLEEQVFEEEEKEPQDLQKIDNMNQRVLDLKNQQFDVENTLKSLEDDMKYGCGEISELRKKKSDIENVLTKNKEYYDDYCTKHQQEAEDYEYYMFLNTMQRILYSPECYLENPIKGGQPIKSNIFRNNDKFNAFCEAIEKNKFGIGREMSKTFKELFGVRNFDFTKNKKIMSQMNFFNHMYKDEKLKNAVNVYNKLFSNVDTAYVDQMDKNEEIVRIRELNGNELQNEVFTKLIDDYNDVSVNHVDKSINMHRNGFLQNTSGQHYRDSAYEHSHGLPMSKIATNDLANRRLQVNKIYDEEKIKPHISQHAGDGMAATKVPFAPNDIDPSMNFERQHYKSTHPAPSQYASRQDSYKTGEGITGLNGGAAAGYDHSAAPPAAEEYGFGVC